jgi:hypothetical protein
LAAALLFCAAASRAPLALRAQAWTAPGETRAHDLTHTPGECLAQTNADIEIGRALFRSPGLLGGPAARAGLSCEACHSSGRINARFLLPELTNRMGAVDVTSEWASKVRGDGVMNPVDIPDLVDVGGRAALGRARDPSLDHFLRGVIVEEFQGQPPAEQALASIVAYLRALDSAACPTEEVQVTLASAAADVRRALAAAQTADAPTANALLLAGQDAIGRIVERMPQRSFARDRRRFETLARELGALRNADELNAAMGAYLPAWRTRFDAAVSHLSRHERRTYFDEATLRRALAQH